VGMTVIDFVGVLIGTIGLIGVCIVFGSGVVLDLLGCSIFFLGFSHCN